MATKLLLAALLPVVTSRRVLVTTFGGSGATGVMGALRAAGFATNSTNVARLPLGVGRARLDRDRDGLLVFFVGVIFFRAAAAVDSFTNLLVAAAPVVMLASVIAIASLTAYAPRRVVGQWGGTGGAICEDHLAFCAWLVTVRGDGVI